MTETEMPIYYKVSNKSLEREEKFKDFEFFISGPLQESGISGKYVATVLITKQGSEGVEVLKDFICSIVKKEQKDKGEVYFIYLNHLEVEEIMNDVEKIVEQQKKTAQQCSSFDVGNTTLVIN